jgi:hypothetical protein
VAEPVVGPDLPVAYPALDTPHEAASSPAVAFGGSVYLTTWRGFEQGIVAARVDRAGTLIDRFGISLSDGELDTNPVVAFDGTNFLVVWQGDTGIVAKRVSPGGTVLDDENIQVSSGPGVAVRPRIAFDGANSFVIWSRDAGGGDIFGAHVSPAGAVLEPADLHIVTGPGYETAYDLAFNGTHHFLVWDPASDIYGTLVTTSGTPLNPSGVPVSTAEGGQNRPAVAALGTSFVVAWDDLRSGSNLSDVYGARVDATGSVLDPAGIAIAATASRSFQSIASDGTNAVVTYRAGNTLRAARVSSSGVVLDPRGVALPRLDHATALAFDGEQFLVVGWIGGSIGGLRMRPNLAVLDPDGIAIALGANFQVDIDAAFDGTNTLVVWSDDRVQGEGPGLYGARVGPDGQILDGTGFLIASNDLRNGPIKASVAFDGTNFLVTWMVRSSGVVSAVMVDRDGEVVDRFQVVSPGVEVTSQAVAFGGGGFLVAWQSAEYTGSGMFRLDVRAARVDTDGTVIDPSGFLISSSSALSAAGTVDLAYGSTAFLVVWDLPDVGGIMGARVETQGPGPVPTPQPFGLSNGQGEDSEPRVAWNGATHLVVWTAAAGDGDHPLDIYGARVDDAGAVLDRIPISTAPGDQQTPTVAANGPFLVTWLDRRRGVESDPDRYATRVDTDGTVGHPVGFAVATSIGSGFYWYGSAAVTAAPGSGNFSVAYERYVSDEPYWSTRAFVRHVTPK